MNNLNSTGDAIVLLKAFLSCFHSLSCFHRQKRVVENLLLYHNAQAMVASCEEYMAEAP